MRYPFFQVWCGCLLAFVFALPLPVLGVERLPAELDQKLWQQWLRLGHYQAELFGYRSTIDAGSFFFSSLGRTDPREELDASWQAMLSGRPLVGPLQLDPICAFPARAKLLKRWLPLARQKRSCSDFAHWQQQLPIDSISLVFASAYFGNPASMFGHSLLKLNLNAADLGLAENASLLDYGVAFAAAADPSEGLAYIVKGLSGAYPGIFQLQPYYELVNEYGFNENRDLWEYELALSKEQADWFLRHLWELYANAIVDYYFFDDNCSYLLLELLDVAYPKANLAKQAGFFVTPLASLQIIHRSLSIQTTRKRDSLRSQTERVLQSFSDHDQRMLLALVRGDRQMAELPPERAVTLADASLQLLQFQKSQIHKEQQDTLRQREWQLLAARSKLGLGQVQRQYTPSLTRVDTSDPRYTHAPKKLVLSWGAQAEQNYQALRIRYGFHDLLDPVAGYQDDSQLNVFDLRLWRQQSSRRIDRWNLTIADVLSLAPINALQPSWAWVMRGGLRADSETVQGMESWLQLGGGLAVWPKRWQLLLYLLPKLELKAPSAWSGSWTLMPETGFVWRVSREFVTRLNASYRFNRQQTERRLSAELRWQLASALQLQSTLRVAPILQTEWGLATFF